MTRREFFEAFTYHDWIIVGDNRLSKGNKYVRLQEDIFIYVEDDLNFECPLSDVDMAGNTLAAKVNTARITLLI